LGQTQSRENVPMFSLTVEGTLAMTRRRVTSWRRCWNRASVREK
jgi:hypothetical protein